MNANGAQRMALRLSRAFAALHAATLSFSAAMQKLADKINENTNRAKLRALYRSYERMAKGQSRRRRYYDPGSNPEPANPYKKPRKRKYTNRTPGKNNERIREAEVERKAKLERRAARANKSVYSTATDRVEQMIEDRENAGQ